MKDMEEINIEPSKGAEEIQEEGQEATETPEPEGETVTEGQEQQSEEDQAVPPAEPRKKTAQERIDEITRARREAEREAEYWRKVALEKEKPATRQEEPEKPATPPRPNLSQFDTAEQYEDALFTWYETKKAVETEAATRKAKQDEAFRDFYQKAKKMREEHEDFDEIIESPVFSPVMRAAILHAENGPAVAYHLGLPENAETANRIRKLPIELQTYEIGKLETQLVIAQKTKKAPGAPPPINPVGMSGGGGEKDPSKMSTEEWMAWDKKRTLDKIKAKYG